jgi:hypothetical protein
MLQVAWEESDSVVGQFEGFVSGHAFRHATEQPLTGFSRCGWGQNPSGSSRLRSALRGIAEAMP